MRLFAPVLSLLVIAMAAACTEQASSPLTTTAPSQVTGAGAATPSARSAGPVATVAPSPTEKVVQFGLPNVGSGFSPTSGHDQSAHAVDSMVPGTVVIDKGDKVTFNTAGVHQVAIYAPGTEPGDIDTTDLVLTPANCPRPGGVVPLLIDDETNRIAIYAEACGPALRPVTHTFTEPGRYLVICAFLPHFQVQMYGWVIVRE
jgi:plastocyanin